MKEQDRISLIENAVANATKKVPAEFKELINELKAEKLAEDLVVNHGLLIASEEEVQEEFVSLDAVESDKEDDDDDFEADENLVDMDQVSESMREIFGE
jgi:hypothetical protein